MVLAVLDGLANAKFAFLLKGTKNVGVVPNCLVCYLFRHFHDISQKVIVQSDNYEKLADNGYLQHYVKVSK
jgi:hypothetical protein